MEIGSAIFENASFVIDRGYDDNKMFLKLDELNQDYVIRITSRRNLYHQNKWFKSTELRNRRKSKIKLPLFYHGKKHIAYLSHVKVQITASEKDVINVANLSYAREGIARWFKTKRPAYRQLCLRLIS